MCERVPVLGPNGEPLMPTKPSRARRWIKSGKAKPLRNELDQFMVQLVKEPSNRDKQDIATTLDPGSKFTGVAVASKKAILYGFNLELPDYVSKRMDKRRELRRNRRQRKTRRREKRFDNRTGHKIAPAIMARKQMELRVVEVLSKTYPISKIGYEDVAYNHFDKKGGGHFSQVEVGKNWLVSELEKIASVTKVRGWETSRKRKKLGFKKTKNKGERRPEAHVNDAITIASLILETISITAFHFNIVRRPKYSRRKLHLEQPAKGGKRRKYGGTTTPFKFRKGDYVEATKANKTVRGWVSGYTKNLISVSNFDWKRMGQFTVSKVRLLQRNNGLMLKTKEVKMANSSPS